MRLTSESSDDEVSVQNEVVVTNSFQQTSKMYNRQTTYRDPILAKLANDDNPKTSTADLKPNPKQLSLLDLAKDRVNPYQKLKIHKPENQEEEQRQTPSLRDRQSKNNTISFSYPRE